MHVFRPSSRKQGEESFGTLELVTSDRDVLAAFKLDELNAVGFNAAFVDFVKGVMLVADHLLRNGGLSPLPISIPQAIRPRNESAFTLRLRLGFRLRSFCRVLKVLRTWCQLAAGFPRFFSRLPPSVDVCVEAL